jgi:DNA invertase Pin-like site-specific DNA recombinase
MASPSVDLKTSGGRLVFGMMAQIAEFGRDPDPRSRVSGGVNPLLNDAS